MKSYTRELTLDAARADKQQRRVPAVISTEYPVTRSGYVEILLHGADNVDLSRSPLPLIESHDGTRLNIGLVENVRLERGQLRGEIVFGNSARARELWPDVEAGIVRHLSIGYQIQAEEWRGETLTATRWMPFETSLVSIPADPRAGTYRSHSMQQNEGRSATDAGTRAPRSVQRAQARDEAPGGREAHGERARASEILSIGEQYGRKFPKVADLANEAVHQGWSVDEFRALAIEAMATQPLSTGVPFKREREERQFSLVRAIASVVDPRSVDAGYEREVSQEMARQLGRKPEGFYMPIGRLSQRVFSAAGAGDMIGTNHLGSEFIDTLRKRSFVMGLGPRILSGLTGDVTIPRLTGSATSGWIAGDGADGLTPSDQTVDSVTLTPKTVGALTVLSRKMVLQADPDAEQMIRSDFAKLIAVELDRAALNGSGAANQPTGVINAAGVTAATFPLAGADFASIVGMEGALMADNADQGSLAYITTPTLAAALKVVEKSSGSGQFVWSSGRERGVGEMNSLPAYASSNVPTDHIVLGNWEDLLMGMWGAIDIAVDPYYDFSKGSIAVRVLASVDFAVRHPKSFVVYTRAAS